MLKLDLSTIVLTLINLIVLYLLMKKFLINPVLSIMKQREAMIQGQFADAKRAQQEADKEKQQYQEKITTAREESVKIVEQARANATAEYEAKVAAAEQKTRSMLEKAQKQIEQEREIALRDMQSEISTLAMAAAGKILSESKGQEQDRSLYQEFFAKAGDVDDADGQ